MMDELTNLAYWFPQIEAAGLPVPETLIVEGPKGDLIELLDGVTPDGYSEFIARLETAVSQVGRPCFMRTGYTSGKHSWNRCCYLGEDDELVAHVAALVEQSHMSIPSLATDTWVVRELIETEPLFRVETFGSFPVTREFRLFVRDGKLEHIQPYWPKDSLEEASPTAENWGDLLAAASTLTEKERELLTMMAEHAGATLGGYWSIDFLYGLHDSWWLIDMAEGDRSFKYEPERALLA